MGEGIKKNNVDEHLVKKKIIKTIAEYKQRCEALDGEVSTLKASIAKLCHVANGVNDAVDEELVLLQDQAVSGGSSELIQHRINSIVNLMMSAGTSKSVYRVSFSDHVQQILACLESLSLSSDQVRQLEQLRQLVSSNQDDDLIVECLSSLLSNLLNKMNETINFYRNSDKPEQSSLEMPTSKNKLIKPRVNQSLQELIGHLMISSALDDKVNQLNRALSNQLNLTQLGEVIDDLTELVIFAYNQEQMKLKSFLREFSKHLTKVESFLTENYEEQSDSFRQSQLLEQGIQQNIKDINESMEQAQNVEQLVETISSNLSSIGDSVVQFKLESKKRLLQSEQRSERLKQRLIQAEMETESLRRSVTYHESRANRDRLTNLPNREAYEKRFRESIQRWGRSEGALCIAVGDVDRFKAINDVYGHLAGDKVLKKIALLIKNAIREVDFVGRYGGEEFVLVFENTPQDAVVKVLNKIRQQIEACEFHCRNKRVIITMSFGITSFMQGDNVESAFNRADAALYRAKNEGRNRVILG